jgi:hypothetical protein
VPIVAQPQRPSQHFVMRMPKVSDLAL